MSPVSYYKSTAPASLSFSDIAARLLTATCVLNLNGFVAMLTGVGQSFSVVVLACSIFLLARHLRWAVAGASLWLLLSLLTYLALANLFYNPLRSILDPFELSSAYINSILVIFALIGYLASIRQSDKALAFVRFSRDVFLASSIATLFSPILYQFYAYLPLSGEQRMGGLFGNPNEAAIVGTIAFALLRGFPKSNPILQASLLIAVSASVVATLSKTGMSAVILVLIASSVWKAKLPKLLFVGLLGTLALLFVQDPRGLILNSVDGLGIELTDSQTNRLLAIPDILSGRVDEQTTTNRTTLWQIILNDAWNNFPFGSGIGSAHSYLGGYYENDSWQGAHNLFLMLFAESGPMPPLMLFAAFAIAIIQLGKGPTTLRPMAIVAFVLAIEMLSTHTAATTRYSNVAFALVFGAAQLAWRANREMKPSPRQAAQSHQGR